MWYPWKNTIKKRRAAREAMYKKLGQGAARSRLDDMVKQFAIDQEGRILADPGNSSGLMAADVHRDQRTIEQKPGEWIVVLTAEQAKEYGGTSDLFRGQLPAFAQLVYAWSDASSPKRTTFLDETWQGFRRGLQTRRDDVAYVNDVLRRFAKRVSDGCNIVVSKHFDVDTVRLQRVLVAENHPQWAVVLVGDEQLELVFPPEGCDPNPHALKILEAMVIWAKAVHVCVVPMEIFDEIFKTVVEREDRLRFEVTSALEDMFDALEAAGHHLGNAGYDQIKRAFSSDPTAAVLLAKTIAGGASEQVVLFENPDVEVQGFNLEMWTSGRTKEARQMLGRREVPGRGRISALDLPIGMTPKGHRLLLELALMKRRLDGELSGAGEDRKVVSHFDSERRPGDVPGESY